MQKLYQAYICEQLNQIRTGGPQWETFPEWIADVLLHYCVEATSWADPKFTENAQMLFICNQLNGIKPLDSVQKFDHIICAEDGKYHLVSGFATKVNQMYCVCIKTDLATVDHCIATNLGEPDPYPQSEEFKQDGIPLGCWDINTSADETGVVTVMTSSLRNLDHGVAVDLTRDVMIPVNAEPFSQDKAFKELITKLPRLKISEETAEQIVKILHTSAVHLIPAESGKTSAFEDQPAEPITRIGDLVYDGSREVYIHLCDELRANEDSFCQLARSWGFSKFNSVAKLDYLVDSFVDKSGCTHFAIRANPRW